MPVFTRHDIDNLGFKAAKDFQEGIPLHTSIVKMARDNSMNPEQIKRLVESANTTAFLNAFKEKTGNQRMVEFDVADPSKVINEAIDGSSEHKSSPSGSAVSITITVDKDTSGLHDTVDNENIPTMNTSVDKVASYDDLSVVKLASINSSPMELTPYTRHKLEDNLLTKIADYNYRAIDIADDIARDYKSIYTQEKYAGLELDALSLYGNQALPALQMVRSRLNMEKIANELSPQQEYFLSDRHVVTRSKNLEKVAEIIGICANHAQVTKSLDYLKTV